MSDLIDRNRLKERLFPGVPDPRGVSKPETSLYMQGWNDAIASIIENEPSAESKTGKWILDPDGMDWNIPAWRCSECGFVATHIGVEPNGLGDNPLNWAGSKFCPQCGARITGYER